MEEEWRKKPYQNHRYEWTRETQQGLGLPRTIPYAIEDHAFAVIWSNLVITPLFQLDVMMFSFKEWIDFILKKFPHSHFYLFIWRIPLDVLRAFSWLWVQGSLLAMLGAQEKIRGYRNLARTAACMFHFCECPGHSHNLIPEIVTFICQRNTNCEELEING